MLYLVGEMIVLIVGAFAIGYAVSWLLHADRSSSSKNVRLEHLTDESADLQARNQQLQRDLDASRDELDDLRREHDVALDSAFLARLDDEYREVTVGENSARRVEIDNGNR